MHEAALYDRNVFVTLTYDDEHMPPSGSLVPADLQKFIKRLRQAVVRDGGTFVSSGKGVRFFACGEYGERTGRPHYHALLFNVAFGDQHRVGADLFSSDSLRALWPFGDHKIGELTAKSAAYVAGYNLKSRYGSWCNLDGEVVERPFLRMSRRPGIGSDWLERFREDLQNGFLVADGRRNRVPRAYLRRLQKLDPALAEQVQYRSLQHALKSDGRDPARLAAGEKIALALVRERSSI